VSRAKGKVGSVHESSMAAVAHFVEQWLDQRSDDHLLIVDHGSYESTTGPTT